MWHCFAACRKEDTKVKSLPYKLLFSQCSSPQARLWVLSQMSRFQIRFLTAPLLHCLALKVFVVSAVKGLTSDLVSNTSFLGALCPLPHPPMTQFCQCWPGFVLPVHMTQFGLPVWPSFILLEWISELLCNCKHETRFCLGIFVCQYDPVLFYQNGWFGTALQACDPDLFCQCVPHFCPVRVCDSLLSCELDTGTRESMGKLLNIKPEHMSQFWHVNRTQVLQRHTCKKKAAERTRVHTIIIEPKRPMWPHIAAMWSGVRPRLSLKATSAPWWMRASTHSSWPLAACTDNKWEWIKQHRPHEQQ